MRLLAQRLMTLLGLALVVGIVGSGHESALVIAAVTAVVAATLIAVAVGSISVSTRVVTVGARAREHRESLVGMPAPQHPATPGRTRSRAPGGEPLTA